MTVIAGKTFSEDGLRATASASTLSMSAELSIRSVLGVLFWFDRRASSLVIKSFTTFACDSVSVQQMGQFGKWATPHLFRVILS
jgi:hypothetical protein